MPNYELLHKFYYEWWKNIDKTLFILIISLFSLGLFFSLASTSLIVSDKLDTNNYFFFFISKFVKIFKQCLLDSWWSSKKRR